MFQLHDRTRRQVCLAAFAGLCVLPTLFVLACGLARQLPTHARAEARRLSWQLGQRVALERVHHPRPQTVRYEGVAVSDPETGRGILRCRTLEAGRAGSTGPKGRGRPVWLLSASQTEVQASQLDQMWRIVQRLLGRRAGWPEGHARLAAGKVILRSAESRQTLTDVQVTIDVQPAETRVEIHFRLAEVPTPEPIQIRIVRNHQTEPPTTGLGIYTGGGPPPCSLLARGLPALEALGSASRFCGYLWATDAPRGWEGELIGQFTEVDLDRLIAEHFPHTLSGTAELTIQGARFRRGRLEEARGTVVAGPGMISRSLVDAAVDRMGLARGRDIPAPRRLLEYDRLAMSFLIDSHGVQLRGQCSETGSRAVLAGRYGPLLGEPASQPLPVAALLQTLVPADRWQVPATRQTDWLIRHLPMPYAAPPRPADASAIFSAAAPGGESGRGVPAGGAGVHVSSR